RRWTLPTRSSVPREQQLTLDTIYSTAISIFHLRDALGRACTRYRIRADTLRGDNLYALTPKQQVHVKARNCTRYNHARYNVTPHNKIIYTPSPPTSTSSGGLDTSRHITSYPTPGVPLLKTRQTQLYVQQHTNVYKQQGS
ncbi:unnamed protein product, partial [Ectocarpus sp. 6 AP-2014]